MAARELPTGRPTLFEVTRDTRGQRAGWWVYDVPGNWIEAAKALRAQRDRDFSDYDVYEREETDLRWVGELGEMVLWWWLNEIQQVPDVEWITERPAGNPDFRIACSLPGHPFVRIGAKTVKRQVRFKRGYCGQVTQRHVEVEPSDAYFFMCYQYVDPRPRKDENGNPVTDQNGQTVFDKLECQRIWLIGACSHRKFMKHSYPIVAGQADRGNAKYVVREGHAVRNLEEELTFPPTEGRLC